MSNNKTPMKRFSGKIHELCEFANSIGFVEVRLNKASPKSRSWPNEDKVGVENDHLIILKTGRGEYGMKGRDVDSVAMVFNYIGVEPSVKFSYRPAGNDTNDEIEESVSYDMDTFRTLLNSFVKELPNIRGFGKVSIKEAFIAAWMKHFSVGVSDTTDVEEKIEKELSKLYAQFEPKMVELCIEKDKADKSLSRASNTKASKVRKSEMYARIQRLREELRQAERELQVYKEQLSKTHSIEEKIKRKSKANNDVRNLSEKYRNARREVLSKYPTRIARKFNRRFVLESE